MLVNNPPFLITDFDIMNNMNVAPNVIRSEGDAYVSKDSDEHCIRSPRASIVSFNPDDGSRPLGEHFTPGPFDGKYIK